AQVERLPAPAHAGVVKTLVGEISAGVALPAVGLAFVEPQAVALGLSQGGAVALDPEAIDRAVASKQDPFEAPQRPAQIGSAEAVVKRLLKQLKVILIIPKAFQHVVKLRAHFGRILNGSEGLFFQTFLPAIPEEGRSEGAIEERRRLAVGLLSLDAAGSRPAAGKAMFGLMARRAGDGTIGG